MYKGENDIIELVHIICKSNGINNIKSCVRMNLGFNRAVYNVNNEFVIKICTNVEKEDGIINEVNLLSNNYNDYMPKLYAFDLSKSIVPYMYTIEEKINGANLFDIWGEMSYVTREECLSNLIKIMRNIHQLNECEDIVLNKLIGQFEGNINKLFEKGLLPKEKIEYLNYLKTKLPLYFENAKFGFIHGDIHFNNLILTNNGLKLIDYECYGMGVLDKDFDSINRMVRNPNSLIKKGIQNQVDSSDYKAIMPFLVENYPEVCSNSDFDNRLLIYDCFNSLKWLIVFPEHKPYHDILFSKSKKLIK